MLHNGGDAGHQNNTGMSPSELNAFRISAVIDRLYIHFSGNRRSDAVEFLNLCLSLARGIDFAISNHEIPIRSLELPSLLKQVCQNKSNNLLQAAVMVLMISVKSACNSGWFATADSEELSNLAKEIASNFCSVSNFNTEPSSSLSVISSVMSRFYPRMKMGHIFAFLEVKPGFDAYVSDFQISKTIKSSPGDKIRLFVVEMDNIETSSCLVSPAKVNFLLNGKGVEARTNHFMDTGPQLPTIVTPLLKYGSNLLQAVGEFNGNYIIVVAFMGEVSNPDSNALQDYEQPSPANVDSDSEIIVGPSRISLNCPISFTRIKTPVKGHLCKHVRCFDFDNYVDINSRRPSWRCPHCNQHICFTDIRIDRKMAEVLKEVGPDVSDIIVSSDWSWNAVVESDDTIKKPDDNKATNTGRQVSPQPANVLDLTQIDDAMDAIPTLRTEDRKHSPNAETATATNSHVAVDFWSGIYMSTFSSNARPNGTQVGGVSLSTSSNMEVEAFNGGGNALATASVPQSGTTSLPNTYQVGNNPPSIANEYGRFPSVAVPSHITRTPTAVQALPAQSPTSVLPNPTNNVPNNFSAASQASMPAPHLRTNPRRPSAISPSSLPQQSGIQQHSHFSSARPPQQNSSLQDPNPAQNPYRVSNEHISPRLQPVNLRIPQATAQSTGQIQSPGSFMQAQAHSGGVGVHTASSPANTSRSYEIAAANRQAQRSVDASRTAPSYSWNPTVPPVASQLANAISPQSVDRAADSPSWRPPGRMRGSLSGQAYTDKYNEWQAQQARSVPNGGPRPANDPEAGPGGPAGEPVGSGTLPAGPTSGMH